MDAYAAGLIDGEGCISILCSKKQSRRYYGATVDVGMTKKALPILERMKQEYGGTIIKRREKTGRWEESWSWRMHGGEAVAFLRRIGPFLLMKKPQVEVALALHAMIDMLPRNPNGTAKWTREAQATAADLKRTMLRLNSKGPEQSPSTPAGIPFARLADGVWLTSQPRLDGTLEPYCETWPKRGSMRSGACWEQTTLARPIAGSGCGSWPTPRTSDTNGAGEHGTGGLDLRTAVARGTSTRQTYQTPSVEDASRQGSVEGWRQWEEEGRTTQCRLRNQVQATRQIPTPTANRRSGLQSHGTNVILGSLNPTWVEWLMGWPRGWTDCAHLVTDRCLRQWLRRSRCWLGGLGYDR